MLASVGPSPSPFLVSPPEHGKWMDLTQVVLQISPLKLSSSLYPCFRVTHPLPEEAPFFAVCVSIFPIVSPSVSVLRTPPHSLYLFLPDSISVFFPFHSYFGFFLIVSVPLFEGPVLQIYLLSLPIISRLLPPFLIFLFCTTNSCCPQAFSPDEKIDYRRIPKDFDYPQAEILLFFFFSI